MATVTLARHSMASRFEVILHGEDPARLRAAGEEALAEVDRLEAQLSLYRPTSEVAHINARASVEPVRVSPPVFNLLKHARDLHAQTGGVFDITIAPLVRAWGFMEGVPRTPDPEELRDARACVGMDKLQLDPATYEVKFLRPGMMIDLGAIGKGYAVEQALEILREAGIRSALLHGGTSTIGAIGSPPGVSGWKIAIEDPGSAAKAASESATGMQRLASAATREPQRRQRLIAVPEWELADMSLSVSSPGGKFFTAEGRTYGHVIDPRTGEPVKLLGLAAVALGSATETDALSTALLVLGREGVSLLESIRPGIRCLVI